MAKKADILTVKFFYGLVFTFLTACSVYGPPNSNPWNVQNQGSQFPNPNDPYNQNNQNNLNDPYNQNNQNNPNDPRNQNNQNNPNNPRNQNNQNNIFNPSPPPNPFPEVPGASRANDLPYELMPDTISALTCEQSLSFDQRRYYTFSVGSYRQPYGGLRLSKDFIENNRIERDTPYQKVRQILESSPLKRAMAQLSVRSEHNIGTIYSDSNKPIIDYFPRLDNPESLHKLSRQEVSWSTRSSSASSVYNSGKFQAFLPIRGNSFVHIANGLEENTIGDSLITLVYSLGNHNPIYSPDKRAYGRSYKLSFRDSHKADYLTGIHEENLESSRREGKWECPVRFMIHRAVREDQSLFNKYQERYTGSIPDNLLKEGFCYTGSPRLSSLEQRFFLEEFGSSDPRKLPFWLGTTLIWRKDGDSEQAYSTKYPCLVPKTGSCYPTQGFYRIEFDPKEECSDRVFRLAGRYGQDPKERDFYKVCPAFLSVCYRTGD